MKILNIGCRDDTYGTHFVDIYPKRKGVLKVDVSKEPLPFNNNSFDEVYMKWVFEHVTNPLYVLQEARRVLKPNGKIIIITDNAGFFLYHWPGSGWNREHYSNVTRAGPNDRHFFLFTPPHLKNFLEKSNFRTINVTYDFPIESSKLKLMKPIINFLSDVGLKNYVNPHIRATGRK